MHHGAVTATNSTDQLAAVTTQQLATLSLATTPAPGIQWALPAVQNPPNSQEPDQEG